MGIQRNRRDTIYGNGCDEDTFVEGVEHTGNHIIESYKTMI